VSKAPRPKAPPPEAAEPDSDATAGAEAAAKAKKKKVILIGAVAALLLLGGGGGAFLFLSGGDPAAEDHAAETSAEEKPAEESEEEGDAKPPAFVDAPEMIVNLRSADGAPRFLKLHVMLVPANAEAEAKIKERLPLILDSFQPYLRELRPQDLAGSAAVFRIKEELRLRATDAVGPGKVKDILIQDMIQQ
jgi:flagellar FliL protein